MDLNFNKNEDHNKLLVSDLKKRLAHVKLGGGQKRIDKLHAQGKMTARERIDFLLDNKTHKNIYKLIILPVAILIWEPVIFFFPFWMIIDFFEHKEKNIFKSFFNIIIFYLPGIFLAFFIAFNPISSEGHKEMANFLKNEFNEACYMSCALLKTKSSI